jgi:hypothetical protein
MLNVRNVFSTFPTKNIYFLYPFFLAFFLELTEDIPHIRYSLSQFVTKCLKTTIQRVQTCPRMSKNQFTSFLCYQFFPLKIGPVKCPKMSKNTV